MVTKTFTVPDYYTDFACKEGNAVILAAAVGSIPFDERVFQASGGLTAPRS